MLALAELAGCLINNNNNNNYNNNNNKGKTDDSPFNIKPPWASNRIQPEQAEFREELKY